MNWKVWVALLAIYIVWGSTYLAIRFAVETMPPFLMAATRFLVSGTILFLWRRAAGDAVPRGRQLRGAAIVGLFLLLGGNGLVSWAEQRVASGIAALLVGSVPLWIVIIDALRPGSSTPPRLIIIGVLIGFLGITLLIGLPELTGSMEKVDLIGAGALIFAAIFWSVGSILGREVQLPDSALMATSIEMLIGGLGLATVGTMLGEWNRLDITSIAPRSIMGLVYLIFFGSLIGFVAYTWLLRVAPTPLVATYAYVNPLVAIIVGNLLAEEPLTPRILLSALVIVSSVALINRARLGKPRLVYQGDAESREAG